MREYNIFISHSWDYSDEYYKLIELLEDEPYFEFKNYSVEKQDPLIIRNQKYYESELRNKIRNQMVNCSVVLILAGVYSTYREFIQLELELAKELEKPIIAIEPFGSERTSQSVKEATSKIVKWNSHSISEAIKEVCR